MSALVRGKSHINKDGTSFKFDHSLNTIIQSPRPDHDSGNPNERTLMLSMENSPVPYAMSCAENTYNRFSHLQGVEITDVKVPDYIMDWQKQNPMADTHTRSEFRLTNEDFELMKREAVKQLNIQMVQQAGSMTGEIFGKIADAPEETTLTQSMLDKVFDKFKRRGK